MLSTFWLRLLAGVYVFLLLSLATPAKESLPITNPIAEPIEFGDLDIHLEHWAAAPATSRKTPRARINCLKPLPGKSGRLFINDLRGPLYEIRNGSLQPYLDIRDHVPEFFDERGLGGGFNFFEFHPEFDKNGRFYTIHSEEPGRSEPDFIGPDHRDGHTIDCVIIEWMANDPQSSVFSGSFRTLMRIRFPIHIHFVQDMVFNPTALLGDDDYGLLYIGVGEGGSMKAGQASNLNRLDSLLGTIIRIDPLGNNSANEKYGIPDTNPWASDGDDDTLGEIWAIGFRNPHRFAWSAQGQLLVTDIGETDIEEINLVQKGGNYGWPHREGTFEFQLDRNKFGLLPLPENDEGYTYPIAQFDHTEARAISGGHIYQGKQHPLLRGKYLFGAIVLGHLYTMDAETLEQGKENA